jgi:hypothetical protein
MLPLEIHVKGGSRSIHLNDISRTAHVANEQRRPVSDKMPIAYPVGAIEPYKPRATTCANTNQALKRIIFRSINHPNHSRIEVGFNFRQVNASADFWNSSSPNSNKCPLLTVTRATQELSTRLKRTLLALHGAATLGRYDAAAHSRVEQNITTRQADLAESRRRRKLRIHA